MKILRCAIIRTPQTCRISDVKHPNTVWTTWAEDLQVWSSPEEKTHGEWGSFCDLFQIVRNHQGGWPHLRDSYRRGWENWTWDIHPNGHLKSFLNGEKLMMNHICFLVPSFQRNLRDCFHRVLALMSRFNRHLLWKESSYRNPLSYVIFKNRLKQISTCFNIFQHIGTWAHRAYRCSKVQGLLLRSGLEPAGGLWCWLPLVAVRLHVGSLGGWDLRCLGPKGFS